MTEQMLTATLSLNTHKNKQKYNFQMKVAVFFFFINRIIFSRIKSNQLTSHKSNLNDNKDFTIIKKPLGVSQS